MASDFIIAIHALAYLRKHHKQISSEQLAENICVHPARVRKVMAKLKKTGIIQTKKGLSGGYTFSIQNDTVTLAQIYDALHIRIFHANWRSGDDHLRCMISSGMTSVVDDMYTDMEAICYEYLKQIKICDIVEKLETIYKGKERSL